MTSNQGINITSYLLGNSKKVNNKVTTVIPNIANITNVGMSSDVKTGIFRILSYILAIIIVILIILLFIHFFIEPIFKLKPGDPGIITVPGFDDGKLYWNNGNQGQILNKDLPIQNASFNYSINLDVFIQNPLQFSKHPRLLLSRGATRKETPTADTLLGILDNYNLAVALLPDTNDLIVSVLNKDNNMENVIIPNIPVQEPFRLGIIIMEKALEVYINGHLMKTKSFYVTPKDVKGDIYPVSGIESNIAKLRNLKIWNRILTTSEIRYATPKLSTSKEMGAGPIPPSSACSIKKQM
jgi:hypothetical protein